MPIKIPRSFEIYVDWQMWRRSPKERFTSTRGQLFHGCPASGRGKKKPDAEQEASDVSGSPGLGTLPEHKEWNRPTSRSGTHIPFGPA
ncbi:hypothetical protein NPIL_685041 [Nephila pilipes]|uniref:Uncharacterized protein n=1 Tax=Nephila pilipes TaxID=299642 RepID=A0A8X6TZK7_NEPPI|nr:hypothetical protein NPIL_685041 [Nephila pilipes]